MRQAKSSEIKIIPSLRDLTRVVVGRFGAVSLSGHQMVNGIYSVAWGERDLKKPGVPAAEAFIIMIWVAVPTVKLTTHSV